MESRTRSLVAAVALAGAAVADRSFAADLRVSPHVSAYETITDNARSATASADRTADWITTVSAGVTAHGNGPRLKLGAAYDLSQDLYADNNDLNGYRHRFLGAAETELVEDMLFLDGRGALSQENVGTPGRVTATDRTVAYDQTRVLNYSVAPRFVTRLGEWTTNTLRYRYSGVSFSRPDVGAAALATPADSHIHDVGATVRSGSRFVRVPWQLAATRQVTTAQGVRRQRRSTVEARGEYRFNRQFGLLGKGGNDDIDDPLLDRAGVSGRAGLFWGTGLHWTPSPRTDVSVLGGHRFGGSAWEGELSYLVAEGVQLRGAFDTRLETQQSALNEALGFLSVTSTGEVVDTRTGLPAAPNDLQTTLVDATFRSKTLDFGLGGTRGVNTLSLSGRYVERDFLASGGTEETGGLAATLRHRLTEATDVAIGGAATRSFGDETRRSAGNSTTYLGTTSLNHAVNDKIWASASYIHLSRDGDASLSENTLMIGIGAVF